MEAASIIVPTGGKAELLVDCIGSVLECREKGCGSEIIVVHTGSTPQSAGGFGEVVAEIRRQFNCDALRLVCEPEPGLLAGRHRGIKESGNEILVFIDDDVKVSQDWLSAILEAFRDQSTQLVGGPSFPRFGSQPPEWLENFVSRDENGNTSCTYLSLLDFGRQKCKIDSLYVWGLNFAIRRSTLIRLGGFHPDGMPWALRKYRGDGETAVSVALRNAGLKAIYEPRAAVFHDVPASRLTLDYFCKRAHLQGISDSYTNIRNLGCAPKKKWANWRGLVRPIKEFFKHGWRSASLRESNPQLPQARVQAAYESGWQYHSREVENDNVLRSWVMRPDYWNYYCPGKTEP